MAGQGRALAPGLGNVTRSTFGESPGEAAGSARRDGSAESVTWSPAHWHGNGVALGALTGAAAAAAWPARGRLTAQLGPPNGSLIGLLLVLAATETKPRYGPGRRGAGLSALFNAAGRRRNRGMIVELGCGT
jgi:hypothetical protein